MTYVNLTPHEIVLHKPDGTTVSFPPSGQVARVFEHPQRASTWHRHDHPVRVIYPGGRVEGLPESPGEAFHTIYIVSALIAMDPSVRGRNDVVAPDTGLGAIRDDFGKIIGTQNFVMYAPY